MITTCIVAWHKFYTIFSLFSAFNLVFVWINKGFCWQTKINEPRFIKILNLLFCVPTRKRRELFLIFFGSLIATRFISPCMCLNLIEFLCKNFLIQPIKPSNFFLFSGSGYNFSKIQQTSKLTFISFIDIRERGEFKSFSCRAQRVFFSIFSQIFFFNLKFANCNSCNSKLKGLTYRE